MIVHNITRNKTSCSRNIVNTHKPMLMSLADQEISQAIICQQTALFSANNLYKLPVTLDYIA